MKIIFLDIDGVLNNNKSERLPRIGKWKPFDPDCVLELERIIEETDAHIVISSTWRLRLTLTELQQIFMERGFSFTNRIIDKTTDLQFLEGVGFQMLGITPSIPRGVEIDLWLRKHPDVTNFVILDDFPDMLLSQRKNFVKPKQSIGLQKKDSDKAIKILMRK